MKINANLLRSFSFLWLGSIAASFFGVAFQVIVAREFSSSVFGVFAAANGIITLLSPLVGFGLAAFWLKAFGEEGYSGLRWIKPSLIFLLVSTVLITLILILWAHLGPHSTETRSLIYILSFGIISSALLELASAKLQLEGKFGALSALQLIMPFTKLAAVLIVIFVLNGDIIMVAKSTLCGAFLISVICCPILFKLFNSDIDLVGHKRIDNHDGAVVGLKEVVSNSWVFGVGGIFFLLWSQSHVVLLKYLSSDQAAGLYGVLMLFINAVCMLPNVLYSKLLMPKIHRWANHDLIKLKHVFNLGNKLMFIAGLILCMLIIFFAESVILLFFGEEYKSVVKPLIVFSLLLPIRFFGHSVGALLVARTYMGLKVKLMGVVALLSLVLNFVFIPKFSIWAVVSVTMFCECLLIALYYIYVYKYYVKTNWTRLCDD